MPRPPSGLMPRPLGPSEPMRNRSGLGATDTVSVATECKSGSPPRPPQVRVVVNKRRRRKFRLSWLSWFWLLAAFSVLAERGIWLV